MSFATTLDREAIIAAASQLPVAPQIMARLYLLLLDFNTGLRAIADLLKRDPALTARVIRIANSPAYGASGVGSIEDAIQRVGFSEVYRLVGSASNASLGDKGLRCYGFSGEAFRQHNLFCALVAERLADAAGLDARSAYTAGLLRRIGQLLLDEIGREQIPTAATFVECGAGHEVEWERRTFGFSHYEVAGILLAEWGFPEDIVAAVEHGHSLGGQILRLGRVVDLTDHVVRVAGLGLIADLSGAMVPQEKLDALGLDQDLIQRVQAEAKVRLQALEASGQAG